MNDFTEAIPENPEIEDVQSGDVSRVKKIFKNPFGHIRAGWRMLAYLIIVMLIAGPTSFVMNATKNYIPGGKGFQSPRMIVLYIALVAAFTFAAYLTLKLVLH